MTAFPPEIEAYVQEKLATGKFKSRDELAIEAVRIYREMESKHAQLKSDVEAALEEADRGLCKPLDVDVIKANLATQFDEQGRPK